MVIKMDHRVFRFATRGHCIKGELRHLLTKLKKKHSAHLSLLLVDQNLEFETSFVAKMVSLLASRSAQAQRLAWAQTNMRGHVICSTSTWSTFKTLFYTK